MAIELMGANDNVCKEIVDYSSDNFTANEGYAVSPNGLAASRYGLRGYYFYTVSVPNDIVNKANSFGCKNTFFACHIGSSTGDLKTKLAENNIDTGDFYALYENGGSYGGMILMSPRQALFAYVSVWDEKWDKVTVLSNK